MVDFDGDLARRAAIGDGTVGILYGRQVESSRIKIWGLMVSRPKRYSCRAQLMGEEDGWLLSCVYDMEADRPRSSVRLHILLK